MKIMYLITRAEFGGAQSHVADLICHFSKENDILLVCGDDGFLTEYAKSIGVTVLVISNLIRDISICKDYKALRDICSVIDDFSPDLIHLHSTKAGLLGRIAGFIKRCPVVFTAHGWAFTTGVKIRRKIIAVPLEFFLSLLGGKIINVSTFDFKLARSFFVGRKKQHYVIHNSVADVLPGKRVTTDLVNLVMVARFNEPKAQDLLIRTLAILNDKIRLTFIGDGPLLEVCVELAKSLQVSDRITFLGSSNKVVELLPAYDIFLLISHYEAFPISILEAMRASLPVIASNVGGISESVSDGVSGILVDNNINSIASAINKLCVDRDVLSKMGHESRVIYDENFRSEVMLKKVECVYSDLLN